MRQLSPKVEAWLDGYNKLLRQLIDNGFKQTPTNAREGLANLTYLLVKERPEVQWIQDDLVHGGDFDVPVRLYHPKPGTPLPVLLYFHGGGHMAGSVTVYDPICRKLALATAHIVVSVDYRLAPECPYPLAINDAVTVIKGIRKTLEGRDLRYRDTGLAVAGDSAGGSMCAILSHMLQHNPDLAVTRQVLIYPCLDYSLQSPSIRQNGKGYLLQREKIDWYFENYLQNNEDRSEISPVQMEFTSGLPETMVITAEFCPLRDDGYTYGRLLADAGVRCEHLHVDDMIHGFLNMEELASERCTEVYGKIASFLSG